MTTNHLHLPYPASSDLFWFLLNLTQFAFSPENASSALVGVLSPPWFPRFNICFATMATHCLKTSLVFCCMRGGVAPPQIPPPISLLPPLRPQDHKKTQQISCTVDWSIVFLQKGGFSNAITEDICKSMLDSDGRVLIDKWRDWIKDCLIVKRWSYQIEPYLTSMKDGESKVCQWYQSKVRGSRCPPDDGAITS